MGSAADEKARPVFPLLLKLSEFRQQLIRIDDHAVADDAGFAWIEHSGGEKMEDVFRIFYNHRMPGICPTLISGKNINP